jgi:CheY-like chemotaxis protein
MPGETILIVDESNQTLDFLGHRILFPLGYKTIFALDGQSGLEKAASSSPDLILLDMNMPCMNGLEILKDLRKTTCKAPVIFMSTQAMKDVPMEAFHLGVRDYLAEPFNAEEVEQVIDRALLETRLTRDGEILKGNLFTAEAVRITVITLSHYLNNYLTTLEGGLTLVEEALTQAPADPELVELIRNSRTSALGIQAVMKVLLNATDVKLANYTNTTPIFNIEAALHAEIVRLGGYQNLENRQKR